MDIIKLRLLTPDVGRQAAFYANTLQLPMVEVESGTANGTVCFKIGRSLLELAESRQFTPYHFAANIPCNQAEEALGWLRQRVGILKNGWREIQPFTSWNAEAVYFYDADYNIVEFIARKNLGNERGEAFGPASLCGISEIGLATNDIADKQQFLCEQLGLKKYSGSVAGGFCAIGDENGLFICKSKQLGWFPTGDKAHSSGFGAVVEIGGATTEISYQNDKLSIG